MQHGTERQSFDDSPLYHRAFEILKEAILANRLGRGTVLLEGPIADQLSMSRLPVRMAFAKLAELHLVHRFDGRGFLVGPPGEGVAPLRVDLRRTGWLDADRSTPDLRRRPLSERIQGEIERALSDCLPFGTYRVVESLMAQQHDVSRTVIREILSRLADRGLLEKDRRSHWIVGPLTAADNREHYEMRQILEGAALLRAAESLTRERLLQYRKRVDRALARPEAMSPEDYAEIERDLHVTCVTRVENDHLRLAIQRHQLPFVINRVFHRDFGVVAPEPALSEHRAVYDALLAEDSEAAADALQRHLSAAERRTRARLKLLSILPNPQTAAYLRRVA